MVSWDVGSCSSFFSDMQMTLSLPGLVCALVCDLLLVVTSLYHFGVLVSLKYSLFGEVVQHTRGQLRSIETLTRAD